MARKERRAQVLAERKQAKQGKKSRATTRVGSGGDSPRPFPPVRVPALYEWMASLLPATGGSVLQVGADARSGAALAARGWRVVPLSAAAVLADGKLGGEPVDAVTCWLLDLSASPLGALQKLKAMGLETADEQRLAVVTLVYRLADRVLRVGGTLQVVERLKEPFGESLATGMVRLQRAQAKGTSLAFVSLDARPEKAGAVVSVRSRKT